MDKITVDDINKYKKVSAWLTKACKAYFDKDAHNWEDYVGWSFVGDNTIVITYSYEEYYCNTDLMTEYGEIYIDIDKLIEFYDNKDRVLSSESGTES
jgi:hypothetical protein